MSNAERNDGFLLPARWIPIPRTISPEAQAILARGAPLPNTPEPDPNDKELWRQHITQANSHLTNIISKGVERYPAEITTHNLPATPLYKVTPHSVSSRNEKRTIFYIHGGGFTIGGGIVAAYAAMRIAHVAQTTVFSVDYRMPPDHPFPAGLDDAVDGYRWLLERYDAGNIAVYGPSAGGGLAAAFILKARDIGLPMPAACALHSPEVDLTESGDSFETNDKIDFVLSRLTNSITLYADGHDLKDPYLSPLFGDFRKGFPPTILTSGTRDLFLSNTVLMHRELRRAGCIADLHIWEAMSHGGFFGAAPEDRELLDEQMRFIKHHTQAN